jgi:alkanesulfonate monooxygenase SsuD/methylene tetrahydromethanopterin reductase-like flavin-dependent oxidoreductase (luciferase family)
VQKPHPPLWVGGESPVALRRAGRLADAWYPIGSNPRYPVGTPAQFADHAASVRLHAQQAGRDPAALDFAYSANWFNDQQAQTLPDGQRRPLTGTPQQVADDIKRYADLGVRHMLVNLQGETLEQTLTRMRRFADRIMPLAA